MKKYAIISGKGGVGKSTIASLVSLILSEHGKTIILDFDLCGPSIGTALNCNGAIVKGKKVLVPLVAKDNLGVISMSSLIKPTDSIIWRGPKKISTLELFYDSIDDYEYVLIDTPPGISEEHGFFIDKDVNIIVVASPQNVSLSDVSRAISFCKSSNLKIIGVIENMRGYKCVHCGEVTNVFGANSVQLMAVEYDVPFLCTLVVEPLVSDFMDNGDLIDRYRDLNSYKVLSEAIKKLIL